LAERECSPTGRYITPVGRVSAWLATCSTAAPPLRAFFFFFTATATTEIYTLSLHDALPIFTQMPLDVPREAIGRLITPRPVLLQDRKSTRLNSSHVAISYAVFCLKKKKPRLPLLPWL